jgi:hypothetical protein
MSNIFFNNYVISCGIGLIEIIAIFKMSRFTLFFVGSRFYFDSFKHQNRHLFE